MKTRLASTKKKAKRRRERVSVPLRALREAVKEAIADNLRAGVPVYYWENGKIVTLWPKKPKKGARSS